MKTNIELEYVAPLTYELFEWKAPAYERVRSEAVECPEPSEPAHNDLGYFMNQAGRFELLSAAEEKRLGTRLWVRRRRLLRILRRASHASTEHPSLETVPPGRPVTAFTRRRLARVETLARHTHDALNGADGSTPSSGLAHGLDVESRRELRITLRDTLFEMDEARRELVERNLRLVVWVAKSFRGRGFDFVDLIQEGNLGLMRAIDRFDPEFGARFSTFATHWIQQGIRRALAEKARMIRIPVNRIPEVRQAIHARAVLSERLNRPAQPDEIAAEIDLPQKKVEELLPAIAPIDSIDAPIAATDRVLADTLEDRARATPLDEAIENETRHAIQAVLHELPERQRVILSMRHGIGYPKECTLEEIGDELGLSRERIRQVEKVAVESVGDWLRKNRPRLAQPV